MAYLRWSGSDWYVFAHTDGGLAVWCVGAEDGQLPRYSNREVVDLLAGRTRLETIPGWRRCSSVSRAELLWTLREFIADECGENMDQIGDDPSEPTLRVRLRESIQKDRDDKIWRAHDPRERRLAEAEAAIRAIANDPSGDSAFHRECELALAYAERHLKEKE